MKKIISFFVAIAMASSVFVTTVSAATLPESITIITSTPEKVTADEYEENTEETLEEGYSGYKVVVTLDTNGVNLTGESSKSAKGVQLGSFTYDILFDDASNLQNGWVSGSVYQSADSGCDKFDPNNPARYFFSSTVVYPGAQKSVTISMPKEMIVLYFAIKDGETATATLTDDVVVKIGNYDGGSSNDLTEYSTIENNIVFSPASFTIGESADVAVDTVTVTPGAATVEVGDNITLNATVAPETATTKDITWTSGNNTIAEVSSSGVVTGVSAGEVVITATSNNGKTGTCTVTVTSTPVAVTGVRLDKPSAYLDINETVTLKATVSPDTATDKTVTWLSSDNNIATVVDGVVTAKGKGIATITAKAGNYEATCKIAVNVITSDLFPGLTPGKKIVTDTQSYDNVSADTRVTVSYPGEEARTFGTTLGEYLQISGSTFSGTIKFAVLCNDDLDANEFTFSITTNN